MHTFIDLRGIKTGKKPALPRVHALLELSANCYISLFKRRPTQSTRLNSLQTNMMPRRRVWAHSLLSWQEMCALSVYFHSCLHCIRCCCLATSLKLLWKHARWFKNRWLWVHVMSEQKKKKKLICCYRASGKQYVFHKLNLPECVLRGFFFFFSPAPPFSDYMFDKEVRWQWRLISEADRHSFIDQSSFWPPLDFLPQRVASTDRFAYGTDVCYDAVIDRRQFEAKRAEK